ncbi:MAG: hypothetical protein FJX23_08410 [Alphaproteobacteria bacterium]|nr:hypothetical protein [Alphaproteobacteria bacterium]
MLSSLHSTATGTFMKIFLCVIVASFALWGIGDVFRTNAMSAASVGGSRISLQEYDQALNRELENYRKMLGKDYSAEIVRQMNVPQQVLQRLVQQRLVQVEAQAEGLTIPDSHLALVIRDNPNFAGENGKFDALLFRRVLAANNLSEKTYLELLARETTSAILLQGAFSGIRVPRAAAELAYRFENEERTADFLLFSTSAIKDIAEPTQEQLETFYKENTRQFALPETRVFSMVALDADGFAKSLTFSEDELKAEYEKQKERYSESEKREVKQLLLADKETADKAFAAVNAGLSYEEAAKEFAALNPDVKLGTVTKEGIIPEAEKAVFSLETGKTTAPIQSGFGWHIFTVSNVIPAHTRTFEEAKGDVEESLRASRSGDEIYDLSTTLQDDLASGVSIDEAAKKVNAKVTHFGPLESNGKDASGKQAAIPEGYDELLDTAFSTNAGETSSILETKDGSYYAVYVETVNPSREPTLEEVKVPVTAAWKSAEQNKRMIELASTVSKELEEKSSAEVAAAHGATLLANKTLNRNNPDLGNGKRANAILLGSLFSAEVGKATGAYPLDEDTYAVAKLVKIIPADTTSAASGAGIANASENLRGVYADEMYMAYMNYLQSKHPVTGVNEEALQELVK